MRVRQLGHDVHRTSNHGAKALEACKRTPPSPSHRCTPSIPGAISVPAIATHATTGAHAIAPDAAPGRRRASPAAIATSPSAARFGA